MPSTLVCLRSCCAATRRPSSPTCMLRLTVHASTSLRCWRLLLRVLLGLHVRLWLLVLRSRLRLRRRHVPNGFLRVHVGARDCTTQKRPLQPPNPDPATQRPKPPIMPT